MEKTRVETANDDSQIAIDCRRLARRFSLDHTDDPIVEFDLADGSPWSVRLVEISENGFSFGLAQDRQPIAVGTLISQLTLDVGGLRIAGSGRIAHVTPKLGSYAAYGVEFIPTSDADTTALASVVSRLSLFNR